MEYMPLGEEESNAPLYMDRSRPLGNSQDVFGRRALHVKIGNSPAEPLPVTVTTTVTSSAVITNPAATGATQVLLGANVNRKGFVILNLTDKPAYISFAPTTTASLFTYIVLPWNTLEKDYAVYTGIISALCAGTGNFLVTDLS